VLEKNKCHGGGHTGAQDGGEARPRSTTHAWRRGTPLTNSCTSTPPNTRSCQHVRSADDFDPPEPHSVVQWRRGPVFLGGSFLSLFKLDDGVRGRTLRLVVWTKRGGMILILHAAYPNSPPRNRRGACGGIGGMVCWSSTLGRGTMRRAGSHPSARQGWTCSLKVT
jgi:hypothetical protein